MIDGAGAGQLGLIQHSAGGDEQKIEEHSSMEARAPKKQRVSTDTSDLAERYTTLHDHPVAMPASPVSEAETPGNNSPVYNTFFIDNADELDTLSQNILSQNAPDSSTDSPVISVIQTPEDLQQDSLTKGVAITDDGDFESQDGLIFGDTPVTLLIDFRHFPTERLPELNELFEQPARLEGRVLKGNVRIVAVISRDMVPSVPASQKSDMDDSDSDLDSDSDDEQSDGKKNVPGLDFWWRINSTCPPKSIDQIAETEFTTQSPQKWVDQAIPDVSTAESMDTDVPLVTLDFTGKDWRSLLFGTPAVSEDGSLIHQPGALEQLQPGSHLTFKNAPWDNQAFVVQLAYVFRSGQFRSNGSVVALPDNLTMCRCPLSAEEIKEAADSLNWQSISEVQNTGQGKIACINGDTIDLLLQETILTEQGIICRHDTLAGWLEGVDGIRITSPLSQSQWLQLVRRLGAANALHLPITTDVPKQQPQLFRKVTPTLMDSQSPSQHSNIKIEVHQSDAQLPFSTIGADQQAIEEFVILPEQSLNKVTQNARIVSLRKRQFECQVTQLIEALRAGKTICLSGLQHNPVLLRQLESLLCQPPHLLIFGKREEFPKLNLRITWPADKEIPSPVWRAYLEPTQPSAPVVQIEPQFVQPFEQFERLYQAMKNLTAATYCPASPPADIHGLFNKVMVQAGCEQAMDGSDELLPYHIYKAVNSVVLKEYRGNPEVYGYLKNISCRLFQDHTDNDLWIDREYLQQWLKQHHWFSKDDIQKAFWSLAKAFPVTQFQSSQIPGANDVNQMMAVLVLLASGDDEAELLQRLDYTTLNKQSLPSARQTLATFKPRSLQQEKQFFNQLVSLPCEQRRPGCIHQQVRRLADAAREGEAALQVAVQQVLTPEACQDGSLVAALCTDRFDWETWEQRRINRLSDKVRQHPVVFIKGETGAGKSYIAEMVAKTLNPELPPHVITVGPETELSDLLGRVALKPGEDQTQAVPAPLRLWAEQKSSKPVVLVIDEANLAIPELWNCLKGLFESPPCLYAHGERIPVSPQHRIIMTGNPDHFSGRRMNELLRVRAPQLYYKPLNPAFVQNKVLHLGLTETLTTLPCISSADAHEAVPYLVETIVTLYTLYQQQLPGRVFTPRDLSDIISRIQTILATHSSPVVLTEAGMNGLVWQALDDALGGEFPPALQLRKNALEHWYMSRKQTDDSLICAQQNRFEGFYTDWMLAQAASPITSQLDCSNDSVRQLMRHIWLEQHRSQQELTANNPHRGRHATVIVGPAGRGKSALLDQQLTFMCCQNGTPPPRQINAGSSSWEPLQQAVKEAKELGRPLIVSELNLLKSEEIEGLLNNATTGKAAPGFHLYITVNPASFSGRHRFSPALKNRMTCLSIGDYTDQDIQTIGRRVFVRHTNESQHKIIGWHLGLRQYLKAKGVSLQPSVGDLKRLARTLPANPTHKQLKRAFETQYSLFLTAAKCTLKTLPKLTATSTTTKGDTDSLSRALNSRLVLTQPVVVEVEPELTEVKKKPTHIAVPKASVNRREPETMTAASNQSLLVLAMDKWQESTESPACPCEHDTLFSACYRLWQQHFIKKAFDLSPDLLPLTSEQQATLNHSDNQMLLDRVQTLIEQPPTPRGLEMLWEKLSSEIVRIPEQTPKKQQVQLDTNAIQQEISRPEPVVAPVDNRTAARPKRYYLHQYFKDVKPATQRIEVAMLVIDGNKVEDSSVRTGQKGVDVICPRHLEEPVYTTGRDHYGVAKRKLRTTAYIILPGLYPHQTITQLSTDPEIPLDQLDITRDRGTGEFLVRLKQPQDGNKSLTVKVHYVVKELQSDQAIEDAILPVLPDSPLKTLVAESLGEGASTFNTTSSKALMESLAQWGLGFQDTEEVTPGTGTEILGDTIKRRQGACRHRAWAAWAVATAYGLPVRIVASDAHRWLECSPDQGKHWVTIDLSGTEGEIATRQPEFKASAKGLIIPLEAREKLLAQAKANALDVASRMGVSEEDVIKWINSDGLHPLEIKDAMSVFRTCLKSRNFLLFQTGVNMLVSGMVPVPENPRSFKHLKERLQKRFLTHLENCQSDAEKQRVFKLLNNVKFLFKGDSDKSGNKQWLDFLETIYWVLNSDSSEADQYGFELFSSFILENNLLQGLSQQEVTAFYDRISHLFQTTVAKSKGAEVQAVQEAFDKKFSMLYPSIKAPANKTPQSTKCSTSSSPMQIRAEIPSLEPLLRTTCIGSGHSWQPGGHLNTGRLLRQQAPFLEQKAVTRTRAVKIVQTGSNQIIKIDRFAQKRLNDKINQSSLNIDAILLEFGPADPGLDLKLSLIEFSHSSTPANKQKVFDCFAEAGIAVPDKLDKQLNQCIECYHTLKPVSNALPSSYAKYLARVTKANDGNLKLYCLVQSEQFRGHRKLPTWQAIMAADALEEEFLPIPGDMVVSHLKKDDGDSLILSDKVFHGYMAEFINNIQTDDL